MTDAFFSLFWANNATASVLVEDTVGNKVTNDQGNKTMTPSRAVVLSLLASTATTPSLVGVSAFDMQMMSTRSRSRSARGISNNSSGDGRKPSQQRIQSSPPPPSVARRRRAAPSSSMDASENSKQQPGGGNGVTSSVISRLAVVALKLRLAAHTGVKCDVTASSSDLLLKQQVGPVTVKGRGWQSPLGLTCRAIEATVQQCDLDMSAVITRQKLILTTPAKGDAMIAMNGQDFSSFINHPLMKPPQVDDDTAKISFVEEGVKIDTATGSVIFYLMYDGHKYRCDLKRGPDQNARAIIDVSPSEEFSPADIRDETSRMLTDAASKFFNELVFELDGTFLSFKDMMVTEKGSGGDAGGASVMLALDITVRKFPSPGLAF